MSGTEHGRGDESEDESMVSPNGAAPGDDSSSLADKGEEKREDYGSTGNNGEGSATD